MKKSHSVNCEEAVKFIENLFKIYLEDRDFPRMLSMLHKDISWFGTGAHEVCKTYDEAVALIEAERDSWDGHFKIIEQWYQAVPIDDDFCVVFGALKIVEDGLNTILLDMHSRVSMVCCRADGEMKLYHAHFSVPNAAQTENEFTHKTLVENYNVLLEEKLLERTKMLKDKTNELQTLANNIYGGVEICEYDEDLTITYISDGFVKLTGYTQEEMTQLFNNKHTALVFPEDLADAKDQIAQQLKKGNSFSIEYRIVKKDRSIIWVLDKGILLPLENNQTRMQCILTDITVQKEHEEQLRVSEKRYEIAMQASKITMFEYNIVTKQLILFEQDARMYGITTIVENGVEEFIKRGIVEPNSVDVFREMYRKIHDGEPFAQCYVNTKDADGVIHEFELSLTSVFDNNGKPIRAIGVRKNFTQIRQLQKENEFGKTLVSNKNFICEADITNDTLTLLNEKWRQRLGLPDKLSFSEMVVRLSETMISQEHKDIFLQKLSKENITQAFASGKSLITFSYKKRNEQLEYNWFEATLNIIKECGTNNINIRYYTVNINERKQKEQKALEEQRLYETMVSKVMVAYEMNLTKNSMVSGHENWKIAFGIEPSNCYSDLIAFFAEQVVHSENRNDFLNMLSREHILSLFRNGERELVCQYRRLDENREFFWVRCMLHIYEDPQTTDVKAYAYVEDIDKQKRAEIALKYKAEHDSLTGFYNKFMTEKLITNFLSSNDAKGRNHVFIMIDIDHFKSINDNFGHVFGDAVLAQIAAKISVLFREDDIVGRIGGDEFVVFMKNISSSRIAISKSKEICTALLQTYYQKGECFTISASVGISVYSQHGATYQELYTHSDSALYASKKNGRNQFSMYHNSMELIEFEKKEFNTHGLLEVRTFEENISEYIFRILYESKDNENSIHSVLSLMGKYLNVSRAYIFEDSANGKYTSNTYEWCNDGVESCQEQLQNISYDDLNGYQQNFNEDGIFYMPDIYKASPAIRQILEPQNVKSMLQFSIVRDNKFSGFIGFDQCDYLRIPSKKEISDCHNITQILGVFIMEMRAKKQTETMEHVAMSIVNALNSYAYVCDPTTYDVLFINDRTMELTPHAQVGQKCFKAFWNREQPCAVCPMKRLEQSKKTKHTMDLYNSNLNVWIKATASWINWRGNYQVCLVDSVDVTEYKEAKDHDHENI